MADEEPIKIDFFRLVRYVGFAALLISGVAWFNTVFDAAAPPRAVWVARIVFAFTISLVVVYHRFIYKQYVRETRERGNKKDGRRNNYKGKLFGR